MPYLTDTDISVVLTITPGATNITELDVMFIDPDKISVYDNAGAGVGAVYVPPKPPTDEADGVTGTYSFIKQFNKAGTWKMIMSTGTSTNYLIIAQFSIRIKFPETIDTVYTSNFNLPQIPQ